MSSDSPAASRAGAPSTPLSPISPSSARRLSNPFTKNQDEAEERRTAARTADLRVEEEDEDDDEGGISSHGHDGLGAKAASLMRKMRQASIASVGSKRSSTHGAIEEESDEELELPPRRNPDGSNYRSPGVSTPASPNNQGLTFRPEVEPAGGNKHLPHAGPPVDDLRGMPDLRKTVSTSEAPFARGTTRTGGVNRTYSMAQQKRRPVMMNDDRVIRQRRLSHDAVSQEGQRRFIVDVEETMRLVLEQEDTDGNFQISITDSGPKVLTLGTATSNGYKGVDIRGTYMLSNLLQELALAREHGRKRIVLDESRLTENAVDRLSRMISQTFWHNLTRRIDGDGLERILSDPKNRSASRNPRIYVPAAETEMIDYYRTLARERPNLGLEVQVLPKNITSEYTRSLNESPGLLALAMRKETNDRGKEELRGIPFIVPGARFNELYNWDSYFISLGLVVDGWVDMTRGIIEHFMFNIRHYGKVLNGNRSYYLMRSQPPFLTDMALQVYSRLNPDEDADNKAWLKRAMQSAIKEYHTVWMKEPRYDPVTGLSRYRPEGLGVPPETEASHFTHVLRPYAEKYGCSVNEFTHKYNHGEVHEPALDEYFMHDRGVRESGHDTSYRFEKRCASLATIDLNSLLYKYEVDIATAIREVFDDKLELEDDFTLWAPLPPNYADKQPDEPSHSHSAPQTSAEWFARAAYRKQQVDKYLWNEGKSLYFDYDTSTQRQAFYESVTSFWAMWAGMASEDQAAKMMKNSLRKFEEVGGLVPGTEDSRGPISLDRPNRQWDYPFAWPPHQMLAWIGLERYNYVEDSRRLAYRWLYLLTVSFVDFKMIPEKFDAVNLSHLVEAEYGNQGTQWEYWPKEGFGWTNASYQVGLTFLTKAQRRALSVCTHPRELFA
ncbi:trehalase-domain-containing protein [Ceraceosorus guamensis]|uniref:Trehalase n=1 Tax=Ceraceosorus guamensis TaxID=1522189 RepID=A0A316VW30_9BASI|nr:trehalase-domain-containing protein [Ceraceosorus guamensis]PWN41816.1 trehalase-domain-containing protein [Ceraceosorus guamensis]